MGTFTIPGQPTRRHVADRAVCRTTLALVAAALMAATGEAANTGRVVSYSTPAFVCLGESLPVSLTIMNTGDTTWESIGDWWTGGEESCGAKISSTSWLGPVSWYCVTFLYIGPGESTTLDWSIDSDSLPQTPGTYTFQLGGYYWYPVYPNEHPLENGPFTVTFRVIDPVNWWDGAVTLDGGWRWLDWLGFFHGPQNGWIYQPELGWLYVVGSSPTDVWFWNAQLGWCWTSHLTYPSIYMSAQDHWFWYQKGSTSPRWFYRFANLDDPNWPNGEWVSFP